MRPVDFDYVAPKNLEETLNYLANWGSDAKILAGGQSLVPLLNLRMVRPRLVVDINRLEGLSYIQERECGVAIGATVRQADAQASPVLSRCCPMVIETLQLVGNPQTRNQGTVVGNLVHHRSGSELPAVAIALGAKLAVAGPAGKQRTVDAEVFFANDLNTRLQSNELVTEVWFPNQQAGSGWAYVEVTRGSLNYALLGVAVTLKCAPDNTVSEARIALTGVSASAVRSLAAETMLVGNSASAEVFAAAGQAAAMDEQLHPIDNIHATSEYRRDVTAVLVERALAKAQTRIAKQV